ncbi:MAG: hypothetical protein O7C75_16430 [Verrucomicrobia bacterium]|nr:hypothetical protein [Verrucomicrobiota bacterium]
MSTKHHQRKQAQWIRLFSRLHVFVLALGLAVVMALPEVSASIVRYTHDAAGRLVGTDYGSGKVTAYRYDENGNLLNRTSTVATNADLRVEKTTDTDSIPGGENFDYTLTVTNDGLDPVTEVIVTDIFPGGLLATSANPSQGTCTLTGQTVECNLGVLAVGASATIQLRVLHTLEGTFTNTATVTAYQADPELNNNTSSDTTTGTAPNFNDYDDDNDGMPNWWEEYHGLSASSSSGLHGADGDRDFDGITSFDEWLADTNPNDLYSYLQITNAQFEPDQVELSLLTSPHRSYTLEYSPDLNTIYSSVETKSGTGGLIVLTDPSPPDPDGFYRIAVEIPQP